MSNKKEIVGKEKTVQAIIVADIFTDAFIPISDAVPHALLPLLNKPLLDYTLEFLSLGKIEEVYLFCCSHPDEIKEHINKCLKNGDRWTLTMKVNVIVSESCQSFGDCLRDLDAKGLIRGDFVLLQPGTISNVQLLPLLEKHSQIVKSDKYAAMTVILQESGIGQIGRSTDDDIVLATDDQNRILFYKELGKTPAKKIQFPIEMFIENSTVNLLHNLNDTGIAICSPSVLPLFSDNFDFQTKEDLIKGLLMNEEILEGTVYIDVLKGSQFGGAVSSWRMYQAISRDLLKKWIHPLSYSRKKNDILNDDVIVGMGTDVPESSKMKRSVLGSNVKVGNNATLNDCFIFCNTTIEDNVIISHSVIGPKCIIKANSHVITGSILGKGTVIEKGTCIENSLVQAEEPQNGDFVKITNKAYKLNTTSEDNKDRLLSALCKKTLRLRIDDEKSDDEEDNVISSDSEEELSYTQSPPPDDTKLFFNEVVDSLTRGFDDNLLCDNLILEINSSRYAYNVTVKEVNFNVVKAILIISLREPIGVQYTSHLSRLLSYFVPVLKNYLRNESAMLDCLQALEEVSLSNENIKEKWVIAILQHLYDKDYITEDVILRWFNTLDQNSIFRNQVKPFADWLEEAEEASSEESDD